MSDVEIDWKKKVEEYLQEKNNPESHTETDPDIFHASWSGKCKRQIYISKLGLEENDAQKLGRFRIGNIFHEEMEKEICSSIRVEAEKPVSKSEGNLEIVGTADVIDRENGFIYDFKTRSGWYKHNPPVSRHHDQLMMYMAATGIKKGRVIYLSKKDFEVRPDPEIVEFDVERYSQVLEKFRDVRKAVRDVPDPVFVEEIPFKKCGCYFCDHEETELDSRKTRTLDEEEETLDI